MRASSKKRKPSINQLSSTPASTPASFVALSTFSSTSSALNLSETKAVSSLTSGNTVSASQNQKKPSLKKKPLSTNTTSQPFTTSAPLAIPAKSPNDTSSSSNPEDKQSSNTSTNAQKGHTAPTLLSKKVKRNQHNETKVVAQPQGESRKKRQKKATQKGQEASTSEPNEKEANEEEKKSRGEKHPCCFMDVSIGGVNAGRIVIELFRDQLPKTCENFRALCTGEKSTETNKLHYKGSVVHRITPGFVLQAGDFDNGDGTGGRSIYGGPFEDEGFFHKHVKAGAVAMANKGKDGNTSQFYITLDKKPLKYLDKSHVVFGRVVVGMSVVRSIERAGTPEGNPRSKVVITDCGRFKLKTERKKVLDLPETPAAPKPTCPQCNGGLKYVKRIPHKKLVRFWCKTKGCEGAVYLPDERVQTSSG